MIHPAAALCLSFLFMVTLSGAELPAPTIMVEDLYSPEKPRADEASAITTEIRSYSYEKDRLRLVLRFDRDKATKQTKSLIATVIKDCETMIYTVDLTKDPIAETGEKTITCKRIKDNTRFYPGDFTAWVIYSKAEGFLFPIVLDRRGDCIAAEQLQDEMILQFKAKYFGR